MKSYSPPSYFSSAAQFYPDSTGQIGTFIKSPMAQTLVTLDYSQILTSGITIKKVSYVLDVQTTPLLVISNSNITTTLLNFIISGGWSGIVYNLTVQATLSNSAVRTDVLTIEVMGDNCMGYDPCRPVGRAIVPCSIPTSYQQAILSSDCSSYKSGCITYYICDAPPVNPNVMDQWYNTTDHTVQEYLTDGVTFWWQPFQVAVASQSFSLYYLATNNQNLFHTTTPDINGKSFVFNATMTVWASVNGVRLVPVSDFTVDPVKSTVKMLRNIPLNDVVMIDILVPPSP
jgi:hypothetical protein